VDKFAVDKFAVDKSAVDKFAVDKSAVDKSAVDKFAVLCKSTVIGETLIKMAYKSAIIISFEEERASCTPVNNSMQQCS
jgi:hypothetical protein